MNKFIKKLFFFNLGIMTIILPFNPTKNLYSETLNKSFEENINKEIDLQTDPYILGPGDDIKIEVLDSEISSGKYTIINDGTVNIPLAGDVFLKGKTLNELWSSITISGEAKTKWLVIVVKFKRKISFLLSAVCPP